MRKKQRGRASESGPAVLVATHPLTPEEQAAEDTEYAAALHVIGSDERLDFAEFCRSELVDALAKAKWFNDVVRELNLTEEEVACLTLNGFAECLTDEANRLDELNARVASDDEWDDFLAGL